MSWTLEQQRAAWDALRRISKKKRTVSSGYRSKSRQAELDRLYKSRNPSKTPNDLAATNDIQEELE